MLAKSGVEFTERVSCGWRGNNLELVGVYTVLLHSSVIKQVYELKTNYNIE